MPDTADDGATGGLGSVVGSALWRGRWLIGCATVLAGAAGFLLSAALPVEYTATSELVLGATQNFDALESRDDLAPERFVAAQVTVLTSDQVLQRAAGQLGTDQDETDLAAALTVSARASSDVVDIAARAPTAEQAVALANAVASAYREFVRGQVQEIADAAAASADAPGTIADIRTRAAAYGDGVSVFEAAELPASPSAPRPQRNALLAAVLAGLVTSGLALWRRDHGTAQAAAMLAAQVEAPLLGIVPSAVGPGGGDQAASTAFDMALVALDHLTLGRRGPVLLTGVDRRAGTAGVVLGLATVASRRRRVLVVDADVRDRSLLAISGAVEPRGRLEDRSDDAGLHRLVSTVPVPDSDGPARLDLAVLGEGVLDAHGDPAAVLANLRALAGEYDLVLVSARPLASDPTAFALLAGVEVVVLAAGGAGRPDPAGLSEARRLLAVAGHGCDALVVSTRSRAGRHRRRAPAGTAAVPAAGGEGAEQTEQVELNR